MTMPLVVDDMDDHVGHAYSGMPDRLYVVDKDGKVAYQGGRGPFGFRPAEMEQALVMLLLDQRKKAAPAESARQAKASAFVPLADTAAAWRFLPKAEKGAGQPLPSWARATAKTLPRATAAMLELDYLHRVDSPLPARLRGMMRWTAAHANRCAFTQAQALADLRRDGALTADVALFLTDREGLTQLERDAVEFARKLTSAAYTVTDGEVAALIEAYGEKQVVAMVQLLAYSNFQDRFILSLGLASEAPLPPLDAKFAQNMATEGLQSLPRITPPSPPGPGPAVKITDSEWLALDYKTLQKSLAGQRAREPRIRVPTPEELAKLNPEAPPRKGGVKWSLVCAGFQPKLAQGWSACTGGFREDARQDRVFEELLFWVVTRSLHCFY